MCQIRNLIFYSKRVYGARKAERKIQIVLVLLLGIGMLFGVTVYCHLLALGMYCVLLRDIASIDLISYCVSWVLMLQLAPHLIT